jgi:hypothetical protein
MTFEIWRRAGEEMRPERTIGSGMKTRVNAGACIEVGGVFFTTDEPTDPARTQIHNAALRTIADSLRAAGHKETKKT